MQVNPCQGLELLHHALVIVPLFAVNGEHAAGLANAHDLLPGELPMNIACQCGKERKVLHMLLMVENRLIQMGDAPALGNVEAKECRQLLGGLARDGVAPCAKLCKLVAVLVKGQIAVHHGGDTNRAHGGQRHAELGLYIGFQIGKAGLQPGMYGLHAVSPYAVHELVFPLIISVCDGEMLVVNQDGLDPGRAQLDAQYSLCQIHHFNFHTRSLTSSSSSSFSGVVSFVMWTNSMSIIRAQSRICSAVTS